MAMKLKTVANQPAWVVRNNAVELAITQIGGQMAPVTFCRQSRRPVKPYFISPWQSEKGRIDEPVLVPLRGDFFCAPFGANGEPYRGETHHVHGEPAGAKWSGATVDRAGDVTTFTCSMKTRVRPGQATKLVRLVKGQDVVYTTHRLAGYGGSMPLGHHATLAVPEEPEAMRVSTSPFGLGMTAPVLHGDPHDAAYQSFAIGKQFKDLARVPLLWKEQPFGDCTAFPTRYGYGDLLAVFKKKGPAWTAAVNRKGRYLWFSLKDPAMLPATLFWIANHDRHSAPWNGRTACLGLEDVCGYFAEGLKPSVMQNPVRKAGYPTAVKLSKKSPTEVHYVQGVIHVPGAFDQVTSAEIEPGRITFTDCNNKEVSADVCTGYLKDGQIG